MFISEVATFLAHHGAVYRWFTPDVPGTTVTVTPTAGPPPDAKFAYDDVGFQVRIRGADSAAVQTIATAIYHELHAFHGGPLSPGGSYVVDCLSQQSSPVYLGRDTSGRDSLVLNFRARVQSSAVGHRIAS